MKGTDSTEKTVALWNWFEQNLLLIEEVVSGSNHPKTQTVIEGLDQHVLDLGRFKWLIDNPKSNHFTFTISPNNDAELFQLSRAIIADAPYYPHWSFFDHIQATGSAPFEIYDAQMEPYTVNPFDWRVQMNPVGNQFEIRLEMNNAQTLDPETAFLAAEIATTALLGEALKIEKIKKIDTCFLFDKNPTDSIFSFQELLGLIRN